MREITATPQQLYGDGRYVAELALEDAVRVIDRTFGEGYAAENPALVGAYVQAATVAGAMANQNQVLQSIGEALGSAVQGIADALDRRS